MNNTESLKESCGKYFSIGVAINSWQIKEQNPLLPQIKNSFNMIVADNEMKPMFVEPQRDRFNFETTDKLISFAHNNNFAIRWHTLCWHNQTPDWMFTTQDGQKPTKEEAEKTLKTYIQTVMEHNKDKGIHSYDVVNECISDKTGKIRDGSEMAKWFDLIGPDYIDKAFIWAHEADPEAILVINDYNLETSSKKRRAMYNLVKGMKNRNIPIHGIGIQMHIDVFGPSIRQIKKTIRLFASLGVKVFVTEMDISLFRFVDTTKVLNTQELNKRLKKQNLLYTKLFSLFKSESKLGNLDSVLLWGFDDNYSWKNDFPVKGRTDYALLFDRTHAPKECVHQIIKNF